MKDNRLNGHKGGIAQKHYWTEPERQIVRREYDGTRASVQRIAQRLGVSFHGVKGQIARVGAAKACHVRWTPEEDAQLRELMAVYALLTVSRKMNRSYNAVTVRSKRLRIFRRYRDGWYTKAEVCAILGVDHKWVQARIDCGSLEANWHSEHRPKKEGGSAWHISTPALKTFIRSYPEELSSRNVDLIQIVEILVGLS